MLSMHRLWVQPLAGMTLPVRTPSSQRMLAFSARSDALDQGLLPHLQAVLAFPCVSVAGMFVCDLLM